MATWDDDELSWFDVDEVVKETPHAYLLLIENEELWLPKSQVKFDEDDGLVGLPGWLAEDKGLG